MADVLRKASLQVRFTGQVLHAARWSRREAGHRRLAIDEKLDDNKHHREWQQPAEDHAPQHPSHSFVTKPFNPRELTARVRAVLRRPRAIRKPGGVLVVGDVRVDLLRYEVTVAGQPVALPRKEFKVLAVLARYPGVILLGAAGPARLAGGPRQIAHARRPYLLAAAQTPHQQRAC